MATREASQSKNEELSFNEKLSEFINKNRKSLLIGLIAIFVVLAGFIITSVVRGKLLSNALSELDGFSRKYAELKPYISNEDSDDIIKQVELLVLLEELTAFQSKNSGFPLARAYSMSADIFAEQKRWAEAEEAWLNAAIAASKTYLASISFFNAAVASEEQGNIDSAIAHYTKALDSGDNFPSAARAQFSIGRLEESRNNKDAALEAYGDVLNKWPNDPVWSNLAQSRILVMSN